MTMGCNCGKKKITSPTMVTSTSKFTLLRKDGTQETFGSRLEAEAARARSGGGAIRPA